MTGKGERRGAPLPCRGVQSLCLKNDENVIYWYKISAVVSGGTGEWV
jgi:hypothetical protein